MKIKKLLPILLLFFCVIINAQNTRKIQTINSGTIENQFDYLIKNSNKYQNYKVVKLIWLNRLKSKVSDSLNAIRKELASIKSILTDKEAEITKLTSTLSISNEDVYKLKKQKDSLLFFGTLISKPLYDTILWLIIATLLFGVVFFIMKFKRSNVITKKEINKFDELDAEYENHRRRSLEREQQLRRKLQDELNKQWKK